MRYLLLVYQEEKTLDQETREHCYEESTALTHELAAKGQFLGAAPLFSTSSATSVRGGGGGGGRGGRRLVTDGPFAETREQWGGFYMVDAADLDEAIAIAARIPGARRDRDRL